MTETGYQIMNKMKLGNDFNNDGEQEAKDIEESDEKTSEEEDEKENSADSDDSKNQDDKSDEDLAKESTSEDDDAGDSEDEDDKGDETKTEDKEKVLNALLDTEKDLDKNNSDIDFKIAEARKRLYQKRGQRRGKVEITKLIDSKFPDTEDTEQDDLSDIDPETLKVLDRFTRAKGLVPKSELNQMSYKEKHQTAEETFYANHKEYLPENDEDDTLYNALQEELSLFAAPKDPRLIPKLFEKAHAEVARKYPSKFKSKEQTIKKDNSEEDKKKSIRLKNASLGGGNSGGSGSGKDSDNSKQSKSFSAEQVAALKSGGWTDKEIQELQGK